jgi:hypothetical protein
MALISSREAMDRDKLVFDEMIITVRSEPNYSFQCVAINATSLAR